MSSPGQVELGETESSDGDDIKESSDERSTHSEEQSRDGSAAFHMNHGQQAGEVALSGSGKEQSVGDRDGNSQCVYLI